MFLFCQKHTTMVIKKKFKKNIKNTPLGWSKKYKFVLLKSPYYGCQKNHELKKKNVFSNSPYNGYEKKRKKTCFVFSKTPYYDGQKTIYILF